MKFVVASLLLVVAVLSSTYGCKQTTVTNADGSTTTQTTLSDTAQSVISTLVDVAVTAGPAVAQSYVSSLASEGTLSSVEVAAAQAALNAISAQASAKDKTITKGQKLAVLKAKATAAYQKALLMHK